MNRPERRNALNPDMTLGLVAAAKRAAEDPEVRAVLLKGAGGTFCVGGDVKSMAEGRAPVSFEGRQVQLRRGMEVSRILHEMSKPVVAQLDGAAAGAGLSIALACDFRVASTSVKITTAFAKVGLSGDYGGTYFLTQMLGSAKARELYLLSPVLTAQEALALGMVTRVVSDAEVERPRVNWRCRSRKGRPSRSVTSSATSTMRSGCRWRPASTPKPSIIRAPAKPPITRKPRKPSWKSASRPSRTTEDYQRRYEVSDGCRPPERGDP